MDENARAYAFDSIQYASEALRIWSREDRDQDDEYSVEFCLTMSDVALDIVIKGVFT